MLTETSVAGNRMTELYAPFPLPIVQNLKKTFNINKKCKNGNPAIECRVAESCEVCRHLRFLMCIFPLSTFTAQRRSGFVLFHLCNGPLPRWGKSKLDFGLEKLPETSSNIGITSYREKKKKNKRNKTTTAFHVNPHLKPATLETCLLEAFNPVDTFASSL